MNPQKVPSELLLIVVLLLGVHALLLWALLPDGAPFAAIALLFGLTLAGAAAAFFVLRPLARDARALMAVLPSANASYLAREHYEAQTEELSGALQALHKLAARAERLEHDDAEARAAIDEAAQLGASFLASMGHDLRGPLNNIIGFADLLVMDSGATGKAPVRGGQRASVDIIRCAAQDLLALLDQVIGWARLQSGPLPLDRKPLPLAELVEHVQNETERRAASRNVAVRARRMPQVALFADRKQLGAALLALIDPSIRSGKSAELELEAVIDPASELGIRSVTLTLRDRGLRVRDADQEAFFEAFRPSFAPTGQRIAGLGVGPALARALVRAHGGDVWLSSRADTGTTFTVTLPLDEPLSNAPEGIT